MEHAQVVRLKEKFNPNPWAATGTGKSSPCKSKHDIERARFKKKGKTEPHRSQPSSRCHEQLLMRTPTGCRPVGSTQHTPYGMLEGMRCCGQQEANTSKRMLLIECRSSLHNRLRSPFVLPSLLWHCTRPSARCDACFFCLAAAEIGHVA